MEKKTYIKPQISLLSYEDIMVNFSTNSSDGTGGISLKSSIDVCDDTSACAGGSTRKSASSSLWDDDAAETE